MCYSIGAKPLHWNCAQYITPQWITNEVYMRPLRVFEHTSCFHNVTQNTCWRNVALWMNSSVVIEWEVALYCVPCHVLFVMRRHDLRLSHETNSTSSVQWDPCSHLFIVACSCRLQLKSVYKKRAMSHQDNGIHSHTKCGPGAIWKTTRFAPSYNHGLRSFWYTCICTSTLFLIEVTVICMPIYK